MTQGSKHWPWPLRSVDVTRNHSWLTNLRQKIERGKFASIDFVFLLKSTEVTWKRRRPDTSCLIFYWLWQSSPSISPSLQSPLSSSPFLSSLPTIIVLQIKSLLPSHYKDINGIIEKLYFISDHFSATLTKEWLPFCRQNPQRSFHWRPKNVCPLFVSDSFSFAIESYLYETDFTLGLSQEYHF